MIKVFKWYFDWSNRMCGIETDYEEIQRQQKRIEPAYKLHREVLHQYGLDAYSKLATPDEIIEDDKPITIINYLDTDFITLK